MAAAKKQQEVAEATIRKLAAQLKELKEERSKFENLYKKPQIRF